MPNRPPPIPGGPEQNHYRSAESAVTASALLIGLTFPGSVAGAVVCLTVWRLTRTSWSGQVLCAILGMATTLVLGSAVEVAWPWRVALSQFPGGPSWLPTMHGITRSVLVELLLGPMLALVVLLSRTLHRHTLLGQTEMVRDDMVRRAKALTPGWRAPSVARPGTTTGNGIDPPGKIYVGTDTSGQPFYLDADEIAQHIFVPGASGYGKTTTLIRLANGALHLGYAVVIVDCKGASLAKYARALAAGHGVPFHAVDPDAPDGIGYDPCTGDPSHIANKLVGAFTFAPQAEIYKQVAMEAVPIVAGALQAAGEDVTLSGLYSALGKGGLLQLSRRKGCEEYRDLLLQLDEGGSLSSAGYIGLQKRFGALRAGKFGKLFSKRPALDWTAVTSSPSVTHLSLSATAAGEDVELFGRVITQDLKQLCDERLRATGNLCPVMVIYDEFAALREQEQIVTLLLQAREAKMPIVVATQYLPEDVPIRFPVLQSGVVIAHRVGHDDAEQLAKEMGTHQVPFTTIQVNFDTGLSEMGSVKPEDQFTVHPNTLRTLPVGAAVVYARHSERRAVVRVHMDEQ